MVNKSIGKNPRSKRFYLFANNLWFSIYCDFCTYFDFKADILKKLSAIINRTQENTKMILGLSELDVKSFWKNKKNKTLFHQNFSMGLLACCVYVIFCMVQNFIFRVPFK